MKKRNSWPAYAGILGMATLTLWAACATTGIERSVRASNSMQDVDNEIRTMIVMIDNTASSLDALITKGQADLKKSFDTYSENVAKLENQGKLVIQRETEMRAASREYFSEWEKQGATYVNPQVSQLSEQRRTKLAAIYDQVPLANAGLTDAYLVYISDLKGIQKYLSNDLTPKGILAIESISQTSVQQLIALRTSLKPVISALDEIKTEMYIQQK